MRSNENKRYNKLNQNDLILILFCFRWSLRSSVDPAKLKEETRHEWRKEMDLYKNVLSWISFFLAYRFLNFSCRSPTIVSLSLLYSIAFVVLLGKTICPHSASLKLGATKHRRSKCWGLPGDGLASQGGSRESRFMLQKPTIF